LKRVGETAESEARGRAWAEIDLGALARNYRAIRARARDKRVIAVVKANAYGHGLIPTALALAAADVSLELRLAMADSVVYATARAENAELVTSDKDLQGLPGVTCGDVLGDCDWPPATKARAAPAM